MKNFYGFLISLILILLFLFPKPSSGQVDETDMVLKHKFEKPNQKNYSVYMRFGYYALETWRVEKSETKYKCYFLVSIPNYENDKIVFPSGTEWKYEVKDQKVLIKFPNDEKVLYKKTYESPSKLCGLNGRDI